MARTKTTPGTAPSAAHAATDPAPAPGAAPAADSPAAAVHAALAASPGSAVTVIADAAGTGKPAARAAAGNAPDPALVTKLAEHLDQIKANADEAELDLATSGDLKTVLAGLDEIAEQAAQARRALKAAIGGRKAPAVRPGGLRDKV